MGNNVPQTGRQLANLIKGQEARPRCWLHRSYAPCNSMDYVLNMRIEAASSLSCPCPVHRHCSEAATPDLVARSRRGEPLCGGGWIFLGTELASPAPRIQGKAGETLFPTRWRTRSWEPRRAPQRECIAARGPSMLAPPECRLFRFSLWM